MPMREVTFWAFPWPKVQHVWQLLHNCGRPHNTPKQTFLQRQVQPYGFLEKCLTQSEARCRCSWVRCSAQLNHSLNVVGHHIQLSSRNASHAVSFYLLHLFRFFFPFLLSDFHCSLPFFSFYAFISVLSPTLTLFPCFFFRHCFITSSSATCEPTQF